MSQPTILLPGDTIDASLLPSSQKRRLHSSIKQTQQPSTATTIYTSMTAGPLHTDHRKRIATISTPNARYQPQAGDLVIAQVRTSSQEHFHLHLTPHGQQAILQHLAFEGASKKTRPQLKPGDLVYAKVISAQKGMDVEVSCVNPATGKSEPDGLGPLGMSSSSGAGGISTSSSTTATDKTNSFLFDISIGFAERLLKRLNMEVVMEDLGKKVPGGFEIAVGKNGKVWVSCPEAGAGGCIVVSKVLKEVDEGRLTEREQKGLVGRIISSMSFALG